MLTSQRRLKALVKNKVLPPQETWEFSYDGKIRTVTDITMEYDTGTIIGFERTKGGERSEKVKRYSIEKMGVVDKEG